jgi:hypothetical protein
VPPQVATALAAIQSNQAAEQAVVAQLEQGFQTASAAVNPDLGQIVNVTV